MIMNFKSTPMKIALAAAAALGLSMTAVPTVTAQARAFAPQVTVVPATNLAPTAIVRVHMTGFKPGKSVVVQQCAEVSAGVYACDNDPETETLNDKGDGSSAVRVHREFEAHLDNGDPVGTVNCNTTELGCFVSVPNSEGRTTAPIDFQ